jgi:phosphatidate cytidylyltransferase
MDLKRIGSAVIGLPMVLAVLILANKYIIDIVFCIIAIISMYEYFNAIAVKGVKPIRWIGYLACLSIAFAHIIPIEYAGVTAIIAIPTIMLLSFIQVIVTEMETNFRDVAYTIFGICYIVISMMCLTLIRGMENGKILIWYAIIAAWATDIFAFLVGKRIGKHKFSKISPKKSIEGCIGGIIGAIVATVLYTYFANTYLNFDCSSYISVAVMAVVLSIVSQVGDFAASSIKRYVEIKDYSELIPGHGGMLDRIDSLIFIAPFAYAMFLII